MASKLPILITLIDELRETSDVPVGGCLLTNAREQKSLMYYVGCRYMSCHCCLLDPSEEIPKILADMVIKNEQITK